MTTYKKYFDDLIKIHPSLSFELGNRDIFSISKTTDYLSKDYLKKLYKISLKYKKTDDKELKFELDYINKFYKYKLYLYFIISSYENDIINFYYDNKVKYPRKYRKERLKDFNEQIDTIIKRLKEGLKLNITVPYMICKEFMKQIKNYTPKLYKFLKNNYINKCRKTIGLCHLPNGKEIYKILVKNTLGGLKKTPEKIYKLGLSSLKDVNITRESTNFYTSKEKLFKDCKKIALYIYDHIIDKYFHYKPDKKFTLKIVPEALESSSSLAYYDASEDIIYINLSYYRECNKQSLYSLLMHECMHQYHYRFMKYHKLEKYQIYGYNNETLIEGFAHYMETYCEDYDDNNDYSILRKLRLVVDTGINYYGWTYEKALNYMESYLPDRRKDIMNEIDRYICNPSQGLCYLLGKLKIIKMRNKFLKEKKGSIKDFHHKLLINGTVSFLTLKKILKKNNN
jgi:uncharacterized protein (DUF885 family)